MDFFAKRVFVFYFLIWIDPAHSHPRSVNVLDNLRQQQAASFAFFDVFWVAAVASLLLVSLVFLMKRPVAETKP